MKNLLILLSVFSFVACQQSSSNTALQKKVDSLQIAVDNAYKPGLGEFMSQIQVHHAKLWFAGKEENWDLANFEVGEIQEALNDIPKYCADRPEVKSIGMITAPIYNIANAIKEKDVDLVDCSSGGNSHAQKIPGAPLYQVPFAEAIKKQTGMKTAAVGLITTAQQAEGIELRHAAGDMKPAIPKPSLNSPFAPPGTAPCGSSSPGRPGRGPV